MNIEYKATVDYAHTTEEEDSTQSKQARQHPKYVSGNYNVNKTRPRVLIVVAMACQSPGSRSSRPPASVVASLTHTM